MKPSAQWVGMVSMWLTWSCGARQAEPHRPVPRAAAPGVESTQRAAPRTRAEELAEARAFRDGQGRPRDRYAALGHYFAAAARSPRAPISKAERELAEGAAYEAALLFQQLRPEATDVYRYWMQQAGLRGLVTLVEDQPFHADSRRFALQALAGYDGSERDRLVAERAAFLAADLLERGVAGSRHPMAARFLYTKAGEAGARRLQSLPALLRIVNRFDGPPANDAPLGPRVFAATIDANDVATRVFGQPMLGTLYSLSSDRKSAGDYLLAATPARWDFRPGSYEPFLTAIDSESESPTHQLVLLAFHADEPGGDPVAIELRSKSRLVALPSACGLLGTPSYAGEETERAFSRLGEQALRLTPEGEQGLIELKLADSEGYSGGGGSFVASWFLLASADGLRDAGCFLTEDRRLIAGDWQPDGSRDHHEYEETWSVSVDAASKRRESAPRLRFRNESDARAPRRTATFDGARYRLDPRK